MLETLYYVNKSTYSYLYGLDGSFDASSTTTLFSAALTANMHA
jgi:hypothetical protein